MYKDISLHSITDLYTRKYVNNSKDFFDATYYTVIHSNYTVSLWLRFYRYLQKRLKCVTLHVECCRDHRSSRITPQCCPVTQLRHTHAVVFIAVFK